MNKNWEFASTGHTEELDMVGKTYYWWLKIIKEQDMQPDGTITITINFDTDTIGIKSKVKETTK